MDDLPIDSSISIDLEASIDSPIGIEGSLNSNVMANLTHAGSMWLEIPQCIHPRLNNRQFATVFTQLHFRSQILRHNRSHHSVESVFATDFEVKKDDPVRNSVKGSDVGAGTLNAPRRVLRANRSDCR